MPNGWFLIEFTPHFGWVWLISPLVEVASYFNTSGLALFDASLCVWPPKRRAAERTESVRKSLWTSLNYKEWNPMSHAEQSNITFFAALPALTPSHAWSFSETHHRYIPTIPSHGSWQPGWIPYDLSLLATKKMPRAQSSREKPLPVTCRAVPWPPYAASHRRRADISPSIRRVSHNVDCHNVVSLRITLG